MAIHERVWDRPDAGYGAPQRSTRFADPEWRPWGTYGLLATMAAFFVAQNVVAAVWGEDAHRLVFTITPAWWLAPWSLLTSIFSHGGLGHIFVNGLVLFFLGPHLERLLGTRRFVLLFVAAGAVSGVLQVLLVPHPALGASGAINMVFGALMMIMPRAKVLLYGIVPMPFWAMGALFVTLDLLGFLGYGQAGVGNVAHLSGLALGVWLGHRTRKEMEARGLHIQYPT